MNGKGIEKAKSKRSRNPVLLTSRKEEKKGETVVAQHDENMTNRRRLVKCQSREPHEEQVNEDEIRHMVRSMCNNAFNYAEIYDLRKNNNNHRETNNIIETTAVSSFQPIVNYHDEKKVADIHTDRSLHCNHDSQSYVKSNHNGRRTSTTPIVKDCKEENPSYYSHFNVPPPTIKNINDKSNSTYYNKKGTSAEEQYDQEEDEMTKQYKRKIHDKVNQHIETIEKTREIMSLKLNHAKKQIVNCIQVLQLHYDDLLKKEEQYLLYLNQCRQSILMEAITFYDDKVKSNSTE